MKLNNKTILIISPQEWGHLQVSKHNYAKELAKKGNSVYFLNPPTDNKSIINKVIETEHKNLKVINYKGFMKGLRYLPKFISRFLIHWKFLKIHKIISTEIDLIWSFDDSVFFDFNAIPKHIFCILHIVDLTQDFNFKTAASSANLCLGVSTPIVRKLKEFNRRSFMINHGVILENNNSKTILPGKNKIKCLYAGNLDIKYIDWELLHKLFLLHTEIDFILCGSLENNETIAEIENVYYLGIVQSNKLLSYYKAADLLLLTYLNRKYPEQLANPHKLMGYLASGKATLATWTEDYSLSIKEDILYMAKTSDDYIKLFKEITSNLDHYNSNMNQKKRQLFAEANSYENQILRIEKLMSKNGR
ncbi:MAG: hypothetical protein ACJASR_000227 [Psychroserpens sp.]|jgi:hypothetical protein